MFLRNSVLLLSALLVLACPADPGGDASSTNTTCGDDGITDSCTDTGMSAEGESGESGTTNDTADDGDGDSDSNSSTETGGECVEDEDCEEEEMCDEGLCVPSCGDVSVVLNVPPPPVMLVLDKSGSMVNNVWDHDDDPGTADETRWKTLHRVTDGILMNFEGSIQFGLQLFPSTDATTGCANDPDCPACEVASSPEVGLVIDNRQAILDAMPDANAGSSTVAGATPAAGGIVGAKTALDAAVAGGAPQMGGAESFYNATNEAELATALDEIAGVLTSCEIDLSVLPNMVPEPSQIEYVEFSIDGVDVPFLETTSEADCLAGLVDGWIWVIEGQTVLFCGAFCDSLKETLEVDGIYGCPEIG